MDSLTAADIMARPEATLHPESDLYNAMERLLKGRLTGLPSWMMRARCSGC